MFFYNGLDLIYLLLISVFSFLTSLGLCFCHIKRNFLPKKYELDFNEGIQKIHDGKVKRIGGISIVIPFILSVFLLDVYFSKENFYNNAPYLIIAIVFFILGFLEDCISNISPRIRITFLTLISIVGVLYFKLSFQKTGIIFIDNLGDEKIGMFLVIICLICNVNTINIMDGVNGLVSFFYVLVLLTLLIYAFNEQNLLFIKILIISILTLAGFLIFNWPFGKIFLGDGGAYFIGAILVLMIYYANQNLEKFTMLKAGLIMIYPVWELIFTNLRRIIGNKSIFVADGMHLHNLIYRILLRSTKNIKILYLNSLSGIITFCISAWPIFFVVKPEMQLSEFDFIFLSVIFLFLYTIIYIVLNKITVIDDKLT